MRALVLRDFWDLAVQELPDPEPAPDEALIEITATGICGSDLHGFTGENGRRYPGQVMGHETVGVVRSEGAGGPRVGTTVTVNPVLFCGSCAACRTGREQACPTKQVIGVAPQVRAAFAELMTVRARNLVALPDNLPAGHGALVEPLAVGYHALRRGECRSADAVLVIGGGPIGQACVLAARRLGVTRVVVSEPDPHRRELNAALGAAAVDPSQGNLASQVDEHLGGPATLAVDAVGASASIRDALALAAPGARVVLVGMAAPQVDLPAYALSTEERAVIGSFCYSAQEFADTAAWVAGSPPELTHLIEGRVDLDDAPAAFAGLAKGENPASKVLVFPSGVGADR